MKNGPSSARWAASILAISDIDPIEFVRRETTLLPVAFVQEILVHQATDETALWHLTEAALNRSGLPPPFWAFPWAGGQGLARYILDNPEMVRGRRVADFAAGSGLVGIAAIMAGARSVTAIDVDPFAGAAVRLNAEANATTLDVMIADIVGSRPQCDVLLAGDVFYDRRFAARLLPWFDDLARTGIVVIAGDPDRTYRPRSGFYELADYQIPVHPALEDVSIKRVRVLRHDGCFATSAVASPAMV